jgi:predicted DCC family thiol-disulfide oxidoreductase YuxK
VTRTSGTKPESWVLYDGACGICSRWVPWWAPALQRLGIGTAALQSEWVQGRTTLAADVLVEDIRLLHADGRLTSGSDVYRYVMRRLWWAYPFYIVSVLPVGRSLFDWGYRTFARHRMRASEFCAIEPREPRDA